MSDGRHTPSERVRFENLTKSVRIQVCADALDDAVARLAIGDADLIVLDMPDEMDVALGIYGACATRCLLQRIRF